MYVCMHMVTYLYTYRAGHGLPSISNACTRLRRVCEGKDGEIRKEWKTGVAAKVARLLGVLCSRYGRSWSLVWLVNAPALADSGIPGSLLQIFFSTIITI